MRGVVLTYDTVREWCLQFGQTYANDLRRRSHRLAIGGTLMKCSSRSTDVFMALWQAVDQDGNVLDILVQAKRDKKRCPSVEHYRQKYQNNRAENSHQPTRLREREMRRFVECVLLRCTASPSFSEGGTVFAFVGPFSLRKCLNRAEQNFWLFNCGTCLRFNYEQPCIVTS